MEAQSWSLTKSARLQIKDLNSSLTFLIGTGADVLVLPKPESWSAKPLAINVYAANMTPIIIYKVEHHTIRFMDNRSFN